MSWLTDFIDHYFEVRQDSKLCKTCKVYEQQLFIANNEKKELLDQILELTKPKQPIIVEQSEKEAIKPKIVPWHIRRQMLEAEDRAKAELLRKKQEIKPEDNKDLENEVLKLAEERQIENG